MARALDAEIVNADAMYVYRGMDIGTAKPTEAERRGVPHHVIDVWGIEHAVSVAEVQQHARAAIDDIAQRDRTAIVVGGSGLYVSAILDDLSFPGTDPDVRQRLNDELDAIGAEAMHAKLAAIDAEAARHILPSNGRRIVRALEVIELTGEPFVAELPEPNSWRPAIRIGLRLDREVLDERITNRVEAMWAAGFVDEVRALAEHGFGATAARALGYQQVLAFLAGDCDEATAKADTVTATRKFARRQERWFARDPRITWLAADAPDLFDQAMDVVGSVTAT